MKQPIMVNEFDEDLFDSFYEGSALTFLGMVPEEAQNYLDYFKDYTDVDDNVQCYIVSGSAMNDGYGLRGSNRYPDDLHIFIVPLEAFGDVGKIAIPRFQIGGRWFDDVVDNNARKNMEESCHCRGHQLNERWSSDEDTVYSCLHYCNKYEKPIWFAELNDDEYYFDLYLNIGRLLGEAKPLIPSNLLKIWEALADYEFEDEDADTIDFAYNYVKTGDNGHYGNDPDAEGYAYAKLNIDGNINIEDYIIPVIEGALGIVNDPSNGFIDKDASLSEDELLSAENIFIDALVKTYNSNGYDKELNDLDGKEFEENF